MTCVYGTLAAYPIMVRQGFGHIVNTSSGAGLLPQPLNAPYGTAKHAVVGSPSRCVLKAPISG
jgi:short-subunit dehydrogenase